MYEKSYTKSVKGDHIIIEGSKRDQRDTRGREI